MSEQVLLILVDGMRPDSLDKCGHPFVEELKATGSYTLHGQTVMPSVTLPCHMSLFHSVPPERHGILSNVYTPQVRPVVGLCEQLRAGGKTNAMFFNWEQLRDVARPGSMAHSCYLSGKDYTYEATNEMLTERAIAYITEHRPDFTFLYLGAVDEVGHKHGWMSDEYIQSVYDSWVCIEKAIKSVPKHYTCMVTADHGGHDRSHGTTMPEDMTIPLFIKGARFAPGRIIENANIIDITPTIAELLQVQRNEDWEGKSLL